MQIAHINNTAGIASIIAHGQKNYGNLVDVFVFNRKTQNLFGGTKINYKFFIEENKLFYLANDLLEKEAQ